MLRKFLALVVLIAFVTPVAAQVTERKDPKEEAERLRKEGVAFLRETMGDVANMRTLENRISFSAEMAGLMWYHDEREARVIFNSAVADFRDLLARLEQHMNELPEPDGEVVNVGRGILADPSEIGRVQMKYRLAMGVRQQMASSMAEHDPDLALSFFYDTATSNPKFKTLYGGGDTYFEMNLLEQIAEKNAGKAAQYGLRTLDDGVQFQHINLLRKIYSNDADKGIEFGSAVLSKAREGKSPNLYALNLLMEYGGEVLEQSNGNRKRPVFSQADMRGMAESMAQRILSMDGEELSSASMYMQSIEKFAPNRAAQIKAKMARTGGTRLGSDGDLPSNAATNSSVRRTSARSSNSMSNSDLIVEAPMPPEEPSEGDQLEDGIEKLMKSELPKEERERAIAQARKILLQTQGRDKQIVGLSMLAAQVAKAGDKELAAEIMRDAERLVNPNPKNYQDFIMTWLVASGYAETDPDRAFLILEDAIGRANNIIAAFIQVGEFIDVTEEMMSDGEAQVGAFGGGMIRGLGKELGIAEAAIDRLVHADFAKTKALTNRFERPEVRVLAKMMVLRTVLGKKAAPTPVNMDVLN